MPVRLVTHGSFWLGFAVIAIAVSYGLRAVGWWAERRTLEQIRDARLAAGLPPAPTDPQAPTQSRSSGTDGS